MNRPIRYNGHGYVQRTHRYKVLVFLLSNVISRTIQRTTWDPIICECLYLF